MASVTGISTEIKPPSLALQPASLDTWSMKYRLKTQSGENVDQTVEDTFVRVARALAGVEDASVRSQQYRKFLWALRNGAIPAGRIVSNAGAQEHKPSTSTINCTVSGTIPDSMQGILHSVYEAGLTLKAGCGIGYEFSTLRPKGAFVSGAGANTSGPLSFMDIFDAMCFTVSSAGGRRGAQMGVFNISHPDVLDFIRVKREDGRLRQFNLSCLITDEFVNAVKNDAPWDLVFPATRQEFEEDNVPVTWKFWPVDESNRDWITDDHGRVAVRIYKTVPAREVWNAIMESNYDFAEPGFVLIDRVNEMNNNWFCENIRATNPCGEQPLPPYGSCLLGSVNLTKFVVNPFTDQVHFDWKRYREVVAVFTRMLDNVVEIHGLPLERQKNEILRKRRHGMGFLGLGSTLAMMKIRYGSSESVEFTERVAAEMAVTGWRVGIALAKEKGAAPIFEETFEITPAMMHQRPEMEKDGIQVGDHVKGKVLLSKYSRYMQRMPKEITDRIAAMGARFTHHSSIAPTGTISLSLGNNVSNGIEPSFSHEYYRNVIKEGKKSKERVPVFSYELLLYRDSIDASASMDDPESLPDYFVTSNDVTPREHVAIQAAAQKWVDSSISKTANVPTDYPFDQFKDIYLEAYDSGLKGCTTFRYNPENFQGVLVRKKDSEETFYTFTLEDGSEITVRGDEEIEYDGEIHSAANLYDALKEGYYGKF